MVRDRYSSSSSSTPAYSNRRIAGGGEFTTTMINGGASSSKPAWLQGLMGETFFGSCGVHENRRKNEKNVFCLICCLSICPHCLPSHRSHPLLQVRRYVYHDVIRQGDLEKLIDSSFIQAYTINRAKVIFLRERAQSRACKGSANSCLTCDRILQLPFLFSSLSCKVDHMVDQGQDLSAILCKIHQSDFAFSQLEDFPMDTSEISTDDEISQQHSEIIVEKTKKNKTTTTKETGFLPRIDFPFGSRRKGAPHRAPLS